MPKTNEDTAALKAELKAANTTIKTLQKENAQMSKFLAKIGVQIDKAEELNLLASGVIS